MPSDKTVRWSAFAYAIFFAVVVSLGYIPSLNVTPHVHNPDAMAMPMQSGEHTMLGLYTISLLDDVTHGISVSGVQRARQRAAHETRNHGLTVEAFSRSTDAH